MFFDDEKDYLWGGWGTPNPQAPPQPPAVNADDFVVRQAHNKIVNRLNDLWRRCSSRLLLLQPQAETTAKLLAAQLHDQVMVDVKALKFDEANEGLIKFEAFIDGLRRA